MPKLNTLKLKENIKDKYVAFLDVMGFSNLVNKGRVESLESYFSRITDVLDELKDDKADIESFLISDSIILIAPNNIEALKQLLTAIRRIQSSLLWKKILLRGAVSFGQIYYNSQKNIVVGKGFIKAYLLEEEANYLRVIIDPSIIKQIADDKTDFLIKINDSEDYNYEDRLIYTRSGFSQINDDAIFIDYANKVIRKEKISGNLEKVYEIIIDNLYGDQKLYTKYVWLRDYFLECLSLVEDRLVNEKNTNRIYIRKLNEWFSKFARL